MSQQCSAGLLVQLEEKKASLHSGLEHCTELQAQDEVCEMFLLFPSPSIPPSFRLLNPSFFSSPSSSSLTFSILQAEESGLGTLLDELRSEKKAFSEHINKLLHCLQRIASS